MFSHQESFDHYKLHTLSDNKGTWLEIMPERGGIVSQLSVAGQLVFYLDRDTLNDASKNVRGGNPVLFPICGPLAEGKYELDGHTYTMKQHGFARNLPWSLINVETKEDAAAVTLRLENGLATEQQYPFEFTVDFTYRLTRHGLTIEQRYHNRSNRPMPFYAGFHPYFAAPQKHAVNLSLPASRFDDFISGQQRPAESIINFDAAPEVNGAFLDLSGQHVQVSNFGQPYTLEIEFSEPYRHIV
ncbi:MAG: aldose epimerase, partial [Acidobacteriota bacterium]